MRALHTERAMDVFQTAIHNVGEDSIDLEIKLQVLRNAQKEAQIAHLTKHLERYGHLNLVDLKTGQEVIGIDGMPIPLKIPISFKTPHDLIDSLQKKLEASIAKRKAEETKRSSEGSKVIDVTDYDYLFEAEDNGDESK